MRIAVVGPLEFPGRQGGMSRHIEEVYARIASDGHDVTVFCRRAPGLSRTASATHRGMRVRIVPAVPASPWDRLTYSALASAVAAVSRFDVVHYHSYSNSGWCFLPRLTGTKVLMTVHRLEWLDEKWGRIGRAILKTNAWVTHRVANAFIAVSRDFESFLHDRVGGNCVIVRIPNGVTIPEAIDDAAAEHLGLEPDGFLLAVSRLVPEKGLDVLLDALDDLRDGEAVWPVAIAGQARHPTDYSRSLERRVEHAHATVRLIGVQPAAIVHGLYRSTRALVAPSRREGNPLTIIEAMAHGTCVVASDIPPHRELLDGTGILVAVDDHRALAEALRTVINDPARARALGAAARARIEASREYQWDGVAARTVSVLATL